MQGYREELFALAALLDRAPDEPRTAELFARALKEAFRICCTCPEVEIASAATKILEEGGAEIVLRAAELPCDWKHRLVILDEGCGILDNYLSTPDRRREVLELGGMRRLCRVVRDFAGRGPTEQASGALESVALALARLFLCRLEGGELAVEELADVQAASESLAELLLRPEMKSYAVQAILYALRGALRLGGVRLSEPLAAPMRAWLSEKAKADLKSAVPYLCAAEIYGALFEEALADNVRRHFDLRKTAFRSSDAA